MGKEDHFMAQMARLDGPAKFLHKSFTVQTDSISNVIGKKLSVESLMSSSTDKNKKDTETVSFCEGRCKDRFFSHASFNQDDFYSLCKLTIFRGVCAHQ